MAWVVHLHPANSTDLTPSDSHPFLGPPPEGYTTGALVFPDDDQLKHNMSEDLRRFGNSKELYATRVEMFGK